MTKSAAATKNAPREAFLHNMGMITERKGRDKYEDRRCTPTGHIGADFEKIVRGAQGEKKISREWCALIWCSLYARTAARASGLLSCYFLPLGKK
jgi:hypothetical protein